MNRFKICALIAVCINGLLLHRGQCSELTDWQSLMHKAAVLDDQLEFEPTTAVLKDALTPAEQVGPDAQILTLTFLAWLAQEQGDYETALSHFKHAASLPQGEEHLADVCDILERMKRSDEARELIKQTYPKPGEPVPDFDGIMRRFWSSTKRPFESNLHKHKGIMTPTFEQQNYSTAWCKVWFRLNPTLQYPLAYVSDSSDDSGVNESALAATQSVSVEKLLKGYQRPVTTVAYFGWGRGWYTDLNHMHLGSEYRYKQLTKLLAWQQAHLGQNHPEVASTLTYAAEMIKPYQPAAAETALAKAAAVWKENGIKCHATWRTYASYADSLIKNHHKDEALPLLEEARKLAIDFYGPDSGAVKQTEQLLQKAGGQP